MAWEVQIVERENLSQWLKDEMAAVPGWLTKSGQASTQAEADLELSRSVLNNILAGMKENPDGDTMVTLSRKFRVSILDILEMCGVDTTGAVGSTDLSVIERMVAIKMANPEMNDAVNGFLERLAKYPSRRAKIIQAMTAILDQLGDELD